MAWEARPNSVLMVKGPNSMAGLPKEHVSHIPLVPLIREENLQSNASPVRMSHRLWRLLPRMSLCKSLRSTFGHWIDSAAWYRTDAGSRRTAPTSAGAATHFACAPTPKSARTCQS
eukprot:5288131-Amphidinium_carterae.1